MKQRFVKALAVGAGAAAAYLAGGKVRDGLPVRGGTLFLLALAGTATMAAARNTAKVYDVENRLNEFLAATQTGTGSHVAGDFHIHGANNVDSQYQNGSVMMQNHNISNLSEINTDHNTWGAHGDFYMNGYNIHMQGGQIL